MRKSVVLFLAVAMIAGSTLYATPVGFLFTNVTEPVTATSKESYTKVAQGSTSSVLGLVGMGDAGIDAIAKKAGITKIKHIDKNTTIWPLGIYIQETFTVYGD